VLKILPRTNNELKETFNNQKQSIKNINSFSKADIKYIMALLRNQFVPVSKSEVVKMNHKTLPSPNSWLLDDQSKVYYILFALTTCSRD